MKPATIDEYVSQLNETGQAMYHRMKSLIKRANSDVCETLFVSNPYYFLSEHGHIKPHYRPSILLFYFKDHVNVFAHGVKRYESRLGMYKVSDKKTLRIDYSLPLAEDVLIELMRVSLDPAEEE